ncbi:MAG: CDP-diacylglycerol--glycerol-3-phosphate 3-phosphatidyltransferase [Oscillospiraceae bacterium]|nr:CDP-diacylglycerol--glycerol-3-phosphate 3-phosphatidyltransferase [Oscillospiraceae bacterium]
MTTANKITLLRIALIPIFMVLMLLDQPATRVAALLIFILAGVTDHIDGYVARKYNQITIFGKFMDPLADKIMVTSAMMILVAWGRMPSWAAVIIIAREFAVSGLRLIAAAKGDVIAAGFSGKLKTTVSIIAICFMITDRVHDFEIIPHLLNVDMAGSMLMVIVTVWSGVEYFVRNRKILDYKS